MSIKFRYLLAVIFTIGSLISIWFFICNLQRLQPALYSLIVFALIGLYLAVKIFNNNLLTITKSYILNLSRHKYFTIAALSVVTAVGLLARLFFYYRFTYTPTSDPMTFFDSAKTLAAGGSLIGDSYIALFPFLAAYDNILGIAMKLIPSPWLATILLNTCFDILSALALYIFLKKILKPHSHLPVVAFTAWLLSPLNIIYSVVSLPVIVVNFFIILTILISYLLIQQVIKLKTKYALLLSIMLGLAIGYGNCFRPVFLVSIIALTVVFIIMFLTTNKSPKFLKLAFGCIVLSLLIFTGIQKLNIALVSNEIGLNAAKNPSGVSLYVGSNWESTGEWRPYINNEMNAICQKSVAQNNYDKCHAELRSAASKRYKSYGTFKLTSLLIRKLYHQAEQQNYFYNAENSIDGYKTSRTFKIINIYSVLYLLVLFTLSANFLYCLAKYSVLNQAANPVLIFIALIFIGWFFAFAFVESAPRYSTILYPAFIIFAVLMLDVKFASKHILNSVHAPKHKHKTSSKINPN